MADTDLEDSDDTAIAEDAATVDIVRDLESDNHTEELKKRALTMFAQITVPVRGLDGTIIGGFVVMECSICADPVLPKAKSLITHMRQHLKAERRGEYV